MGGGARVMSTPVFSWTAPGQPYRAGVELVAEGCDPQQSTNMGHEDVVRYGREDDVP